MSYFDDTDSSNDIAVIGLACRFPGADNEDEFWQNLCNGVCSISYFSDEELLAAGEDSEAIKKPGYVKARSVLDDFDRFDAAFFDMNPREAEILDPQNRLLLECSWQALELAGYDPDRFRGQIGVFAGAEMSGYHTANLYGNREKLKSVTPLQVLLAVDRGYLSTRISYELNLKGPSMTVQTSCSTSLVAAHLACESLLSGECDMALIGGVSVLIPHRVGYFYEDGGIVPPDGVTRAFDANSKGTLFGSGVGAVVLRRLEDAAADGDFIHALIKGSAVNNDGSAKVGYMAPSVEGQARVITEALGVADIDPETITYIESHGTATNLGDPIEIEALNQAFRQKTQKKGFCAIGAVKTNLGHLAAAAGMAGLIKTILALRHAKIPPSLNYENPNPQINFDETPFYVNRGYRDWRTNGHPRRAGVSSFGMGGTNAHIILEEAPLREEPPEAAGRHLLLLSAKTSTALNKAGENLLEYMKDNPGAAPADIAYTLQMGRVPFEHRRILVCEGREDAAAALKRKDPKKIFTQYTEEVDRPVVFMFPGLGDHYPDMSLELYRSIDVFRKTVDKCCDILKPLMGMDLREVIFPGISAGENAPPRSTKLNLKKLMGRESEEEKQKVDPEVERLNQTVFTQPAIFVVEYSLAQMLIEWGIRPHAVIGHSIGEYTAACTAGVFSLQDALTLVVKRAGMINELPGGAMLGVPMSEEEVKPFITGEGLSLSAVNTPNLCVLSGTKEAVNRVSQELLKKNIVSVPVQTSHAFHSIMMEPVMAPLTALVKEMKRMPPAIPYMSTLTGDWVTEAGISDPHYWANHTRMPVRFSDGIAGLLQETSCVFVEVGPGRNLTVMGMQNPACGGDFSRFTPLLRNINDQQSDMNVLLTGLGNMWLNGVTIDWKVLHGDAPRFRIPLPTYPFERQRYWIEPQSGDYLPGKRTSGPEESFYHPAWKNTTLNVVKKNKEGCYLVFAAGKGSAAGLSKQLTRELRRKGHTVFTVLEGKTFSVREKGYTIRPGHGEDYRKLFVSLIEKGLKPAAVFHLWNVAPKDKKALKAAETFLWRGFFSLFFIAGAVKKLELNERFQLVVISSHVQQVMGDEDLHPERAMLLGPCSVIPMEIPGILCCSIDIPVLRAKSPQEAFIVDRVISELNRPGHETAIAYRGRNRWVQFYEPVPLPAIPENTFPKLRRRGVYLITEDYRGITYQLALFLARELDARLILVSHTILPEAADRDKWLAAHGPQDPASRLIRTVRELEAMKADIIMVRANIADFSQMDKIVRAGRSRYGTINGVVHGAAAAAGKEGPGQSLKGSLIAGIRSIRLLEQLFRDIPLDFTMLCSSLSSEIGGPGQIANAASESFLNAYARSFFEKTTHPVLSVKWDRELADDSLWQAFLRILYGARLPQVIVCERDFFSLLEQGSDEFEAKEQPGEDKNNTGYARPNLPTEYISPSGDLEEQLADMWGDLLGVKDVGRNDSFFRLGGHSLVAIQLLNRVRETFDVDISAETSFEAPTIAELAERIKKARESNEVAVSGIIPVPRENGVPLSLNQEVIWEDSHNKESQVFNLVAAVTLKGKLDMAVMQESVNRLIRRHEVLRTTFTAGDNGPAQVIAADRALNLSTLDWREGSADDRKDRLDNLVEEAGRVEFDPAKSPPWDVKIAALTDDEHVLLINFHPIIMDDRSVEIFILELARIYQAISTGAEATLKEHPVDYADFALWQRQHLRDEALTPLLAYWERQLTDISPPGSALPAAGFSLKRESLPIDFPPGFSEKLKELGRREESTLFMTLLAAFQAILYHYTGKPGIPVRTPMLNRDRKEIEDMLGTFENIVILRTDVNEMFRFSDLLSRVKLVIRGTLANLGMPFRMILKHLGLEPGQGRSLCRYMFIYRNDSPEQTECSGLTWGPVQVGKAETSALTLRLSDTAKGINGAVDYDPRLYNNAQVETFVEHYRVLLERAVQQPDSSLSQLLDSLNVPAFREEVPDIKAET